MLVKHYLRKIFCALAGVALLSANSAAVADIQIVATIKPLQLIATAIVDGSGNSESILPANQSPHHYALKPRDRALLAKADLILWIGPELETFLSPLMEQLGQNKQVIQTSAVSGLTLHRLDGNVDPHLWLNTDNALVIGRHLLKLLETLDSQNIARYRSNFEKFEKSLTALNKKVASRLAFVSDQNNQTSYIVYHSAYQYFEAQFSLQHDLAIVDNPEQMPTAREIMAKQAALNTINPSCVLLDIESSSALVNTVFQGQKNTQTVNQITVDLMGDGIPNTDTGYTDLISGLSDTIANCLSPSD